MKNNIDIDTRFGELLSAIDQFYKLSDKDDISRTVSIARQLFFSSPTIDDTQKAIKYLKELNFTNNTYCEDARSRLINLILQSEK